MISILFVLIEILKYIDIIQIDPIDYENWRPECDSGSIQSDNQSNLARNNTKTAESPSTVESPSGRSLIAPDLRSGPIDMRGQQVNIPTYIHN